MGKGNNISISISTQSFQPQWESILAWKFNLSAFLSCFFLILVLSIALSPLHVPTASPLPASRSLLLNMVSPLPWTHRISLTIHDKTAASCCKFFTRLTDFLPFLADILLLQRLLRTVSGAYTLLADSIPRTVLKVTARCIGTLPAVSSLLTKPAHFCSEILSLLADFTKLYFYCRWLVSLAEPWSQSC